MVYIVSHLLIHQLRQYQNPFNGQGLGYICYWAWFLSHVSIWPCWTDNFGHIKMLELFLCLNKTVLFSPFSLQNYFLNKTGICICLAYSKSQMAELYQELIVLRLPQEPLGYWCYIRNMYKILYRPLCVYHWNSLKMIFFI